MSDIMNIIRQRHSTRAPFDPSRRISKRNLIEIIEAARWSPTPHNMQNFEILVIDSGEVIGEIGRIGSRISEDFLRENYQQMSFSKEELIQKKVGVLGTMFPPSWRDPSKFSEVSKTSPPTLLRQTIQESPTILIVVYDSTRRAPASQGDFLGILGLGCVMENMWLVAQSLGIAFQVMSVFGGEPVEKEMKTLLNIPERQKIAYAIRLGYPLKKSAKYTRVRRDIKSLTHHNRYGKSGNG